MPRKQVMVLTFKINSNSWGFEDGDKKILKEKYIFNYFMLTLT